MPGSMGNRPGLYAVGHRPSRGSTLGWLTSAVPGRAAMGAAELHGFDFWIPGVCNDSEKIIIIKDNSI